MPYSSCRGKSGQMRRKDNKFYSYAHKEIAIFFKMMRQQRLFAT